MRYWAGGIVLGLSVVLVLAGCGSDDERAPGLNNGGCSGASCGGGSGGGQDAAPDDGSVDGAPEGGDAGDAPVESSDGPSDAPAETYTGPVGDVTGTVFLTSPPLFPVERNGEYPLTFPASLSVWAHGKEYAAPFDPTTGYSVKGVPVGAWTFLVRDEGGQNGILDSAIEIQVVEGSTSFDFPAFGKNSFVVIYGGLTPPIIRDPALAQVVLTFETCAAMGGQRLAGVVVDAPAGTPGVLYHSGISWGLNTPDGTSDNGVAIVPNVDAIQAPGMKIDMSYTYAGQSYAIPAFDVFRGGIFRVVVVHPC